MRFELTVRRGKARTVWETDDAREAGREYAYACDTLAKKVGISGTVSLLETYADGTSTETIYRQPGKKVK